jgi:hypothetical protein
MIRWTIVMVVVASAVCARGGDVFTLSAQSLSGTSVSVNASGSSLPDLVENAYKAQSQFVSLSGRAFNAALRYGPINNAVSFSRNAAGTSATLQIPSIKLNRTFTAANQDDLADQIRDFFVKNDSESYSQFLRSINENTSLGINDGNPLATTALIADVGFRRFGIVSSYSDDTVSIAGGIRLTASGGAYRDSDADLDGYFGAFGFSLALFSTERVALVTANTFRYRDTEGASIYQYASNWGLPIQIILSKGDSSFAWQLTPAFVSGAGGSWDLAAGGILLGGQITSSLAYQFRGGWSVVMANQYGFYEGLPIDIGDFRSESDVSQQILKNGIALVKNWNRAFIDVGVNYTNFLRDSNVDGYVSPSVGAGFRWAEASGIRVGYQGDFASDFKVHSGMINLFFEF